MKGVIGLLYCTELNEFIDTSTNDKTFSTDEITVKIYKNKNGDQCIDYTIMIIYTITVNLNKNSTKIKGSYNNCYMELPYDCEDRNEFFQLNCYYDFHDFKFEDLIKIQEWTKYFLTL